MSTIGNAVGTWTSCAPLRSCTGASTSTASGSCGSHADRINQALSRLRELRGGDWEPCEFIRLQEELGLVDVIGLHGYLIVKLCNVENPRLSPQFMRLDWGHDGFAVQVAASDTNFCSYFGDAGSRSKQFEKKYSKTVAVTGGFLLGGAIAVAAAVAAAATGTAATGTAAAASMVAETAFVSGAQLCVAAGAANMSAGAASAISHLLIPNSLYEKIGQSASMRSIIRAVEAKAEVPYDLVAWNCNHFANYLVDVLRTQA